MKRRSSVSAFPLLLPCADDSALEGFVTCDGRDYGLRVVLPPRHTKPPLAGARFEWAPDLAALLVGFEEAVGARIAAASQSATCADELVGEVRDALERVLKGKRHRAGPGWTDVASSNAAFYERLVVEVQALSQSDALVGVNARLDEVRLRATDDAGRTHHVTVALPPTYPEAAPVCYVDLPEALDLGHWNAATSNLHTVLQALGEAARRYGPLWTALDDLDQHTWVLEPTAPSRSSCSRRIAVAPHCSVLVTVAPLHPLAVPVLRFLGADKTVQPLKDALNSRLGEWDPLLPLHVNLAHCLAVEFPSAVNSSRDAFADDHCAICYEYRLADAVPEVVCDNERCSKAFHRTCLYDWLRAIPSSKTAFASVYGACPWCEASLVVHA